MSILQSNRLQKALYFTQDRLTFIASWTTLLDKNYDAAIEIYRKILAQYPAGYLTRSAFDTATGTIPRDLTEAALLSPMAEAAELANFGLPNMLKCSFFDRGSHNIGTSIIQEWAEEAEGYADTDAINDFLIEELESFRCESCDRLAHHEDSREVGRCDIICASCCEDSYTWSDYEDRYVHNDDVANAIDSDGDDVVITAGNYDFTWNEDMQRYVHDDYESESDEDAEHEEHTIIRGYHSSKSSIDRQHDVWTDKYKRFIGVELEVECNRDTANRGECALGIHRAVNSSKRLMFFENDGSLSYGFEMITQPMSLPAHRELFKFLQNPDLIRGMRSHGTSTCGLHVHVSKLGLTPLQIQKVVAFINSPDNEWFIRALARRYSSGYSTIINDKKIGKGIHYSSNRYEAVNLTNSHTMEFRIFRGSLKYEAVIAAIEFSHAIVEFCRPAVTSANQLSAGSFLTFCSTTIASDTKILRSYVTSRLKGRSIPEAETEAA